MQARPRSRLRQLRSLLPFVAASYGAAALGGLFTARSLGPWYRGLRKPRWTPPDQLFGPVWTMLYGMMAVSAWLVRSRAHASPGHDRVGQAALLSWWLQLVLNVLWSAVFFGRRSLSGGLAVIAPLWGMIASTAVLAARARPLAGLLLLPYLAWTGFAAALNYRIWQLNRRRPLLRRALPS
uniref:Tryptophan-rich sensory protein n=1 Tax=Thermorudis peleae TaxID=1382356 RepID=A0A831TI58_9BACT